MLQYLPWLRANGFECDSFPLYSTALFRLSLSPGKRLRKFLLFAVAIIQRAWVVLTAESYDLILMHREALPFGPPMLERLLKWKGIPVVFTYDDALFLFKPNQSNKLANWFKRPDKYLEIFSLVDCVVAANPWLKEKAGVYCKDSRFLAAAEDLGRFTAKANYQGESSGSVILGWIGSPSTEKYLRTISGPLRKLTRKHPGLKLRIVGGSKGFRMDGVCIEQVEWSLESEVGSLHSFDIGLMPLPKEEWSKGKSGGKARAYMAVGLPAVCSEIGFNNELINHGETGFLVSSETDWVSCLDVLISDVQLRKEIGQSARRYIEDNLSTDTIAPKLARILTEVSTRSPQ